MWMLTLLSLLGELSAYGLLWTHLSYKNLTHASKEGFRLKLLFNSILLRTSHTRVCKICMISCSQRTLLQFYFQEDNVCSRRGLQMSHARCPQDQMMRRGSAGRQGRALCGAVGREALARGWGVKLPTEWWEHGSLQHYGFWAERLLSQIPCL